jgi:hypothetical protein
VSLFAISIKSWKICEFLLTSPVKLDFESLDQLSLEREKCECYCIYLEGRRMIDQRMFEQRLDQLTRKQKIYLRYFLQGMSDDEIILQPDTGNDRTSASFHLNNVAKQCDIYKEEPGERRRSQLAYLFYRYRPKLVSPKLVEKYKDDWGISILAPSGEPDVLEEPTGFVPIGSPLYLQPKALESCVKVLMGRTPLLRIKAPRKFGKTSLVERLLRWGEKNGYDVVRFDFQTIDEACFTDLHQLLKELCREICRELEIDPQFEAHWQEQSAINACNHYFTDYLLKQLEKPVLLGLDNVDRLFDYPQAHNFFGLLRSWNEEAKRATAWTKLKCIVTYSTGVYIKLDLNQSPFNVGQDVTLEPFSASQVKELAMKHGLARLKDDVQQLMKMLNGQPYLVRLVLYHLADRSIELSELLRSASAPHSVLQPYLQGTWERLNRESPILKEEILTVLQQLGQSQRPAKLTDEARCKLEGMGLIRHDSYEIEWSCDLYRQYFQRQWQ